MISKKELRSISLDFRRVSSNLLTTGHEQAGVSLARFYKYINETGWIYALLEPIITETNYDFQKCFMADDRGREFQIPVDEKEHIKAQYDYMHYILENNVYIVGLAMRHCLGEKKFDNMVRTFFSDAFKPLIDFINDAISKEIILLEEENKQNMNVNIAANYGTANFQGSGVINSENIVNPISDEIICLIEKILPSLEYIKDVPVEQKESVQDDLESIQEQIASATPKKSRLQKALNGIKNFVIGFPKALAVNMATTAITNTDWTTLIEQIETFIANL